MPQHALGEAVSCLLIRLAIIACQDPFLLSYTILTRLIPPCLLSLLRCSPVSRDLKENSITALAYSSFVGLTLLLKLHLERNSITAVAVGVFRSLTRLTKLELRENSLTAIPGYLFATMPLNNDM